VLASTGLRREGPASACARRSDSIPDTWRPTALAISSTSTRGALAVVEVANQNAKAPAHASDRGALAQDAPEAPHRRLPPGRDQVLGGRPPGGGFGWGRGSVRVCSRIPPKTPVPGGAAQSRATPRAPGASGTFTAPPAAPRRDWRIGDSATDGGRPAAGSAARPGLPMASPPISGQVQPARVGHVESEDLDSFDDLPLPRRPRRSPAAPPRRRPPAPGLDRHRG